MIRFKCIYCGQRVVAHDDVFGKQGKCPKCSHILRIPKSTAGGSSTDGEKSKHTRRAEILRGKSHIQTWGTPPSYPPDHLTDEPPTIDFAYLYGEKAGWLVPTYDILSLFLMAVTTILLLLINDQMKADVYVFMAIACKLDARLLSLAAIFLAGLCLCLYHAFTKRETTKGQKRCMVFFAVTANAVTGILAGIHFVRESTGWLLILPIWNIANSVLMVLMLWLKIINETCISDHTPTTGRVVIGVSAILVILAFCNFIFKLYWPITFSICIIYATSIDRALQSTILHRTEQAVKPSC